MFKPVVHEVIAEGNAIEEINVDDNQEIAEKYGIMSVPVILILELDETAMTETVVDAVYGVVSKDELLRALNG